MFLRYARLMLRSFSSLERQDLWHEARYSLSVLLLLLLLSLSLSLSLLPHPRHDPLAGVSQQLPKASADDGIDIGESGGKVTSPSRLLAPLSLSSCLILLLSTVSP